LGYASPSAEGMERGSAFKPRRSPSRANGLANLEALELGRAPVEGLVLSGPMVSGPKGLGSGPGLERGPALPYGVGGIQCVIFGLRAFEQAEFHKPRHRVEITVTRQPYVFESLLRPFGDARFMAINIGGSPGHGRSCQSLNGSNTSEPAISTPKGRKMCSIFTVPE